MAIDAADWVTAAVGWLAMAFGLWVGYAVGRADRDGDDDDDTKGGGSCSCSRDGSGSGS